VSDHFVPDDPLADRPAPEYVEMVDPDPPPHLEERSTGMYAFYGGQPWPRMTRPEGMRRGVWWAVLLVAVIPVLVAIGALAIMFLT
jgi:hypothetical protein